MVNGDIETWIVCVNSKLPVSSFTFSSNFLTASAIHPLKIKKVIYGAGDKQGEFFNLVIQDAAYPGKKFYIKIIKLICNVGATLN